MFNPQVCKLKPGSSFLKPRVDYRNSQNIFLSFENVGCDFFFPLVHFVTFLETSYGMEEATFGHLALWAFLASISHGEIVRLI